MYLTSFTCYIVHFDSLKVFVWNSSYTSAFCRKNKILVQDLFWEGHKNLRNLPHGFAVYLVHVKTLKKISQFSVAFSEKLNFILYKIFVPLLFFLYNFMNSCQCIIVIRPHFFSCYVLFSPVKVFVWNSELNLQRGQNLYKGNNR